ncbi:hypothetical protein QBC43DRAFT_352747 [Cladorrhinum sp. PSN259]|nr:hypothetical protein QBC43DRAFT_352747 [Cladorrhinum sp. PSN259]
MARKRKTKSSTSTDTSPATLRTTVLPTAAPVKADPVNKSLAGKVSAMSLQDAGAESATDSEMTPAGSANGEKATVEAPKTKSTILLPASHVDETRQVHNLENIHLCLYNEYSQVPKATREYYESITSWPCRCGEEFRWPGELSRHIREERLRLKKPPHELKGSQNNLKCGCGKQFAKKEALWQHLSAHTANLPFAHGEVEKEAPSDAATASAVHAGTDDDSKIGNNSQERGHEGAHLGEASAAKAQDSSRAPDDDSAVAAKPTSGTEESSSQ